MKKIIAMALALVLVAGLSIGGTVAYLQDDDSQKNTMTLGNVEIEQLEYQRAENIAYNATAIDGSLVAFEQNQCLYPAVPAKDAERPYTAEATDLFEFGPYTSSGTTACGLWNDAKLSNQMDKFVFVKNTGKSDCYYRTIIAFECPEGMEYSQGSDKEFMMNANQSQSLAWTGGDYWTISGTRYYIAVATYNKVLSAGKTSIPTLLQVVMTHNATNEDMKLLGDTYDILVLSQAVQTAGFADAATALNTAFGEVNAANVAEWFKTIAPTVVTTGEELQDAIDSGASSIELGDDIELDGGITIG